MKVLGIISEYNPFHYGHKYHIDQSKKTNNCDYTVVIMSGSVVQRGEFAILEQHKRAQIAVENGADLVLELPVCYSSQSAEIFGYGAVNLLNRLGLVDTICCGSESNNLENINILAPIIVDEKEEYTSLLKTYLEQGLSFPKARSQALQQLTKINIGHSPNDILALEYSKALYKLKSHIKLSTIKRNGQDYSSTATNQGFASATGIREAFKNNTLTPDIVPEQTLLALNKYGKTIDTYNILQAIIIREGLKIETIFDIKEGIENSILSNIKKANSKEELMNLLKSKRYTHTRISRILNNILLGLDKKSMETIIHSTEKPYTKILALNQNGKHLLSKIDQEQIKLINKPATFTPENQLQKILYNYDTIANDMYLAMSKETYISQNQISPVVI